MKTLKKTLCLLVLSGLIMSVLNAQLDSREKGLESITIDVVKSQLDFLASDWTEGRGTGQKGIYLAGDYIASMFKVYGLMPGGDFEWTRPSRSERMRGVKPEKTRSYFQNFSLIEYYPGEDHEFSLISQNGAGKQILKFAYRTDFTVNTSDVGTEITAPVVFVGYGLVDKENNYDDFKGVDVEGKIILRLSGYPGHKDTTSNAYKKFHPEGPYRSYYLSREKNKSAEKYGALGVIEVDPEGDLTRGWATNVPFRYNYPYYEGDKPLRPWYTRMSLPGDTLNKGINVIRATIRAANEIVKGTVISFKEFEEKVQKDIKPFSQTLKGKTVFIKTTVNSKIVRVRNVLGVIEGENTDEILVVGGHYDHMGMQNGYIWNGSDDNASGTVGVMTLAKACMATGVKPKRTIVFAAWTGEERGLLGSEYFVQNPTELFDKIMFNLNYDMISRDEESDTSGIRCNLTYTKAFPILEEMTLDHIEEYNIDLEPAFRSMERPRGGSDFASFAAEDIPVLSFNAGFHPDYHQPTDHTSKANWGKMVEVIKVGFLNLWELANMDTFLQ